MFSLYIRSLIRSQHTLDTHGGRLVVLEIGIVCTDDANINSSV